MNYRPILALSAIIFAACTQDTDLETSAAVDLEDRKRWESFKRAAIVLPDTDGPLYVFGGDMVAIGEDGLRREYERYFGEGSRAENGIGKLASPLSVGRVNGADNLLARSYADSAGGRFDVVYCIERATFNAAELAALEPELKAATASWSTMVNVSFRHDPTQDATCSATNANVFFNVVNVTGSGFNAAAFFPDFPRASRLLRIDDLAFTTTAGGRDLQGILRHEIGHILGFLHEHIWITCTGERPGTARHVTPYDENSVMHYPQCRTSGTGGYRQTQSDYRGAIELYGLSPALILTTVL